MKLNQLTWIFVFFLLVVNVNAVIEETSTYRIECTPDSSTIKSYGFHQTCSYLLKHGTYTGDVAFCFDSTIKSAKVVYNGVQDITSQFKFKHYNFVKGECYYVEDVIFVENVTKTLDIYYLPENISKSTKWDTYFGDVSSNRIDLILDPVYNLSLYEIGTMRDSSYYWKNSGVLNSDVNITNANINTLFITTSETNYTTNSLSSSTATLGTDELLSTIITTNTSNIVNVTFTITYAPNTLYVRPMIKFYYNDTTTNNTYGSCININGASTSLNVVSNASKYLQKYEVYTSNSGCGSSYGPTGFNYIINSSERLSLKSSANLTSNPITLPILVNTFRLNANFTGSAFINITFDGINYRYLNLSNTTQVNLSDSLVDNSNLSYKLHLLNNATTIYNISLTFNGISNQWDIFIYNETTNTLITQNVTVTLTDLTNSTIRVSTTTSGNLTFTEMPLEDVLELRVSAANYSSRTYYRTDFNTTYNRFNVYLIPNSIYQNFSICWYDYSGAVISNLLVYQYYLSSSGYVLSQSVFTDIQGKSNFVFNPSSYYKFNYSSSASPSSQTYSVVPFILNPPQNTLFLSDGCNYDITLKPASSAINYTILNVVGQHSFNNVTRILNFSYVSTESNLNYSYLVYNKGSKVCSGSSLLTSTSFACNLTSYEDNVYIYGLADDYIFYSSIQDLGDLKLSNFLSIEESSFISGIIFLVVLIAGASLGVIVSIIFSAIALIIIMWLGIFSGLSVGIVAIVCVIGIIIGVIIRRYR